MVRWQLGHWPIAHRPWPINTEMDITIFSLKKNQNKFFYHNKFILFLKKLL
jgi:hypothetical protein